MPKLVALLMVVAASTSGVGAAPDRPLYAPAGTEALSADLVLDGYVNGHMEVGRLMTVRGCTLERDAAYLYSLMMEAAARDGVRLGFTDCYRSYEEQKAAYNKGCPPIDIPRYRIDAETGQWVQDGVRRMRTCDNGPIAAPGRSNHGWGRAVDFTAASRGKLTCYDSEYDWLRLHAHEYGWVHPDWAECGEPGQEPWHWEFAGVTEPNIVPYTRTPGDLYDLAE